MVKSADRTLDVFELFARERQPLLLTDIAEALGAPLSSCFNLIGALKERGFLYDTGHRRQVYPTRKMLELVTVTAAFEPWAMQIEPKLARLRDLTQETTILGRRQADEALYLAVFEGPQNIRYTAHAGDRKPLHSSSIGKALLCALEKNERDAVIGRLDLE
ncbi:MAG: IclR family transcriptional regulator, partial [Candidatus Binataceae bacterium]